MHYFNIKNPRPLKIIDKEQTKRYIMSSPYKPNGNEKKISKVFYYEHPHSPIHRKPNIYT